MTRDALLGLLQRHQELYHESVVDHFEAEWRGVWIAGRLFDRGPMAVSTPDQRDLRYKVGLILRAHIDKAGGRAIFTPWFETPDQALAAAVVLLEQLQVAG